MFEQKQMLVNVWSMTKVGKCSVTKVGKCLISDKGW